MLEWLKQDVEEWGESDIDPRFSLETILNQLGRKGEATDWHEYMVSLDWNYYEMFIKVDGTYRVRPKAEVMRMLLRDIKLGHTQELGVGIKMLEKFGVDWPELETLKKYVKN